MTKKIFAMFLAVLMVISLLPTSVFAAEKTCPGKGNHTPENCNCTVVQVVAPTCAAKGFTRYKCDDCGEEFDGDIVKATGEHNYVATADKAPTCEEDGYQGAMICTGCGDVKAATKLPRLSEYNCQWEIVTNATCTEGGTQEWKCSVCGATKTVKVEKGDHEWDNGKIVKEPTASANGLATRTCKKCGEVKEIIVFYSHDCKKDAILVQKAATCTTDGVKLHWECRVCGNYYVAEDKDGDGVYEYVGDKMSDTQKKNCIIPAGHDYGGYVPTCADTLVKCVKCNQWVNPGIEHDVDWVYTPSNLKEVEHNNDDITKGFYSKAATCTEPGFVYDVCSKCHVRLLKTVEALGHDVVTVTKGATCATYGYTYTYCKRAGCTATFTSDDYTEASSNALYKFNVYAFAVNQFAPVANKGYYFALKQENLGSELYFNGKMDGYYLGTTTNVGEAVFVYVEAVHQHPSAADEFVLYFYDAEGVKTYIEIYEYNTEKHYVGVQLTTTRPTVGYKWNDTYKVMTTKINGTEYCLGTEKTYNNFSAKAVNANGRFNVTMADPYNTVDVRANYHIISFTLNKKAGLDTTNHVEGLEDLNTVLEATCTTDGKKVVYCKHCGEMHEEVIPAGHSWRNASNEEVKTEAASKAVGCEDGWQWKICNSCNTLKKETYTGSGHVYGADQIVKPDHMTTTGYTYKTCKWCGDVQKWNYTVWEYIGKQFESYAEASAAHGGSLVEVSVIKTATCTVNGLTKYHCNGCQKDVFVIVKASHKDSALIEGVDYENPTCTEKGWILTYTCPDCKANVGAAPLGERNEIAALGHDFQVGSGHVCNDCDNPYFMGIHASCSRSGCTEKQYCFELLKEESLTGYGKGTELCETTTYQYYYCRQCNDVHIRNYVAAMGHDYVDVLDENGKVVVIEAATCTKDGSSKTVCTICGKNSTKKIAQIAHKNKAGVEFWDHCDDTVEDRHCVLCCKCTDKGSSHDCINNKVGDKVVPCDCVIGTNHVETRVMMPSSCDMPPYYMYTCTICGHIRNEVQTEIDGEKVIFSGHKPAEIDYIDEVVDGTLTGKKVEQRYPGFTYVEEYEYVYYTVKNGKWVKNVDKYTAKFIDRKAATYTEEGYDLMYCQICGSEEKNEYAKLTGLGFQMTVANANGAKGLTYGSLVEVTISAVGNNVSFYGFEFDVATVCGENNAAEALRFVGYEAVNAGFNFTVTDPAKVLTSAKKAVKVIGYAKNDVAGKMQNVTVTEETALIKLYFRVCAKTAANYTFSYTTPVVKKVVDYMAQTVDKITANTPSANASVVAYLDYNTDGFVSAEDAYLAMALITGEHPNGLTYSVAVDVDKDGEITLADLSALYDYLVGNKSVEDLFKMGVSENELLILGLAHGRICNNSECNREIPDDAVYCPYCKNHQ